MSPRLMQKQLVRTETLTRRDFGVALLTGVFRGTTLEADPSRGGGGEGTVP